MITCHRYKGLRMVGYRSIKLYTQKAVAMPMSIVIKRAL